METPLLYRQLQDQLSQWVQPKDQRHLQGFAEIVAAILQAGEASLGRWIEFSLGLRELARLCYERLLLPVLQVLPKCNPPSACASQFKRDALDCRIEFSKIVSFSF